MSSRKFLPTTSDIQQKYLVWRIETRVQDATKHIVEGGFDNGVTVHKWGNKKTTEITTEFGRNPWIHVKNSLLDGAYSKPAVQEEQKIVNWPTVFIESS
jgi:hypothetical protein